MSVNDLTLNEPTRGQIWHYEPRKSNYLIVDQGKMKFEDGEWVKSVTYRCLAEGILYTRDVATFVQKFILLQDMPPMTEDMGK